jgi:hypothetical protein
MLTLPQDSNCVLAAYQEPAPMGLQLFVMLLEEAINPILIGVNGLPTAGNDDGVRMSNNRFVGRGEATV